MKKLWLFLAFVAVAVATSGRRDQTQKKPPRWQKPCIGCYTVLGSPDVAAIPLPKNSTVQIAEPGKQPPRPGMGITNAGDSTLSVQEPSEWAERPSARRTKREERKASLVRRRGKGRAGSRPVCRGCYSGLMIVAPPVHTSNNTVGAAVESHSESEWDSSQED